MNQTALSQLIHVGETIHGKQHVHEEKKDEDVISVSESVSVAVSLYETLRNTLEYDEEHLLRRNAIRRILKRRIGEMEPQPLANKFLRELIWSKYLPNHQIHSTMVEKVSVVLEKYKVLLSTLNESNEKDQKMYEWILDVLSTELEYVVSDVCLDNVLTSFAFQTLKERVHWQTELISKEDQELQLYLAIHRSVLKSNEATLRYRILTLYYPKWVSANANEVVVEEIRDSLPQVISLIESQLFHPASESLFRFIRRHSVVFRLFGDVVTKKPHEFETALELKQIETIDRMLSSLLEDRYRVFRSKLSRTVLRAAGFLLLTKSILAVLIEYPYEVFILKTTDYLPLVVNILFPPFLLACIGLSVQIPTKKNTTKILEEVRAFLKMGNDVSFVYKQKSAWNNRILSTIFNVLYVVAFVGVITLISMILRSFHFNVLSIIFFIFFLSLVAYFGIRIRNTRRDLILIDSNRGFISVLSDILFLPLIRAGRYVALRAPKINIFLFFFDFIIEAPFKGAVELVENWFAFLKEKREEL